MPCIKSIVQGCTCQKNGKGPCILVLACVVQLLRIFVLKNGFILQKDQKKKATQSINHQIIFRPQGCKCARCLYSLFQPHNKAACSACCSSASGVNQSSVCGLTHSARHHFLWHVQEKQKAAEKATEKSAKDADKAAKDVKDDKKDNKSADNAKVLSPTLRFASSLQYA